ncbi:unnamed protein product [Pleuronectes platessa]|uniref:Uncharacterized protein n=1 Tax=Pleuronectes platessa TaxID=8262 RepID=A0A9N7Y8J1_PLEPL|nr:unnamed protein product [Pleuronectes platessa]
MPPERITGRQNPTAAPEESSFGTSACFMQFAGRESAQTEPTNLQTSLFLSSCRSPSDHPLLALALRRCSGEAAKRGWIYAQKSGNK